MIQLKSYVVWDAPTRWFHWINVLCVIALTGLGLMILNDDALELSSKAKILLKTLHVWVGYVFVLNLLVRIVRAFTGSHYAHWRQMLPAGRDYARQLRSYISSFFGGPPQHYLGHNPLGRIAITGLLLVMMTQASTGLLLSGTDIYFPPFGHWIAQWIAAPGTDPANLVPYSPAMYDKAAYTQMRAMREPFALVHLYGFYLLAIGVVIHVAGVVIAELREGTGLVSAMISGRKVLTGKPVDAPEQSSGDSDHKDH
jgi:Ni/Fe-hydrogenase 1 B-type cytochrome subunit